ncbi:MAG: hypothetical protein ACLRZH_16815 [Ruthenibacterium lactatiformans]
MFFARAGYFDKVDAVFAWHPGPANYVSGQGCLAVTGVLYSFKGRTAHAAGAPFAGRSALDAAELMNVGCNYLREHIIPEARLHYAYRDVGGTAPNVVQESACVHYYIRAPRVAQMLDIKRRVDDVARGRADDGHGAHHPRGGRLLRLCAQQGAVRLLWQCMREVGAPAWDEANRALAAQFAATLSAGARGQPGLHALGHGPAAVPLCGQGPGRRHRAVLLRPQNRRARQHRRGRRELLRAHGPVLLRRRGAGHRRPHLADGRAELQPAGLQGHAGGGGSHGAGGGARQRTRASGPGQKQHAQSCPDGYTCPMPENAVPAYVE